jgi:hypothetical protein
MTPGDQSPARATSTTNTSKSQSRKSATKAATQPKTPEERHARTATVNLPFVTAEFRAPDVHMPHVLHPSWASVPLIGRLPHPHVPGAAGRQVTDAARVVGSHLPDRDQLALFAGLGAVAAAGVIEWPVAAAVAGATVVAKRGQRSSAEQGRKQRQKEPQAA